MLAQVRERGLAGSQRGAQRRFALRVPVGTDLLQPVERPTLGPDGELLGDGSPGLDPRAQVAHQIPAAPAVGGFNRSLQLLIGQIEKGLIWSPRFALFVEEGQTVGIHASMVAPGAPLRRCAAAPD